MRLPLKKRKVIKNDTLIKNKKFNKNIENLKKSLMNCQLDRFRINKLKTYDYNIISYLILFYLNLCKMNNKSMNKYIFRDLDKVIELQYGIEIKQNLHYYSTRILHDLLINLNNQS